MSPKYNKDEIKQQKLQDLQYIEEERKYTQKEKKEIKDKDKDKRSKERRQ